MRSDKKRIQEVAKIAKGFANHWRIEILLLLEEKPELSVAEISGELGANFKTVSEHARRLGLAGLVLKRYEGASVRHKLTRRGHSILKFLRILE